MKRYCLTPRGKGQLVEFLGFIAGILLIIIGIFAIIGMLIMFDNTTPLIIRYIGLIGWMVVLSWGGIALKRWIHDNIEEC